MIKDKFTPELKKSFSESIKKAEESGNEHGFFMCINKDGKLFASQTTCEGDACEIHTTIYPDTCPGKNQGFFHVHAHKLEFEKRIGRKVTEEDIKNIVITDKRDKIITAHTPSHADVLQTLLNKCNKLTEGTICTVGDLEPDKVECWTIKRGAANFITCPYAKRDILAKETDISPKKWIRPLFNKGIIDLKKDP